MRERMPDKPVPDEIGLDTPRGPLAALRFGCRSGPRVLALHGWLDNAASFVPLAAQLDGFDLVALDLPGHGASAHRPPGGDYAFADWIHDALDALDALGWERAHLLGHSMGGAVAALVAAATPARVDRLILIESPGPIAGDPAQAGRRLREAVAARRAQAAKNGEGRLIPDVDTAVAARRAAGDLSPAAARLIVGRNLRAGDGGWRWRSDPRLMLPAHVRADEATIRAWLRAIEAPTLAIAAETSPPWFPPWLRDERLACLRDGRLVLLPGGHHLHMETPERVAAILREFLGTQD